MTKEEFKNIDAKISSSMRMMLDQLRKFLRQGRASVMVGAGFSKNARLAAGARMKNWYELCCDFHTSLFGLEPSDADFSLKSALRLAQQVECAKGRDALDEIIRDSVPDEMATPDYLHKLLVGLNWRDIFTTNYDTLLERAAVSVYKHYHTVTSRDSLIYRKHPRIVKLHGSFPDNHPFVITEEDYRTYPQQFPEFVNTVRQAMLETQFCLIGFSGDDPNFLSWLGWIRDIMGERMLPVYMIYVGKRPHDAEVFLLEKRKIRMIVTDEIDSNPDVAMDFILCYIGDKYTKPSEWCARIDDKYNSDTKEQVIALIDSMKSVRKSYPDWMLLPAGKIKEFDDCRKEIIFLEKGYKLLERREQIHLLYELNWRIVTSFMPIWLEKDWFNKAITDAINDFNKFDYELQGMVKEMALTSLRTLRIRRSEEFADLLENLKLVITSHDSSLYPALTYEEALWYLGWCDYDKLNSLIDDWHVTSEDYLNVVRKSRILIEIGRNDEAQNLLESALDGVRRVLLSKGDSPYYASAKTVISDCLWNIKHDAETRENINPEFSFRMYYDFVRKEIADAPTPATTHSHGFSIGSHSTTWNMGEYGFYRNYVGAARYYLMSEAFGRPIGSPFMSYNSDLNRKALALLAEISLPAAMGYLVESCDTNGVSVAFSRKVISQIDSESACDSFDKWLQILEESERNHKILWSRSREANVILPYLSRLCIRLDESRIIKLIHKLLDLYGTSRFEAEGFLSIAYSCLPVKAGEDLWWKILERPITLDYRERDIPRPNVIITAWKGSEQVMRNIISGMSSDDLDIRRAAVNRLGATHNLIPEQNRETVNIAITSNFDALVKAGILNTLGVLSWTCEVWYDMFRSELTQRFKAFISAETIVDRSSITISNFESDLALMIDCRNRLEDWEKLRVTEKIRDFLMINAKLLREDDSKEFFGGLKHHFNQMMRVVNVWFEYVGLPQNHEELRTELLHEFSELSVLYPLCMAIAKLSFVKSASGVYKCSQDDKTVLIDALHDGLQSSESLKIHDAFEALALSYDKSGGKFAVQELVAEVLNLMRYVIDSSAAFYLRDLTIWVREDILMPKNKRLLLDVIKSLPKRIIESEISDEYKAEIFYFANELVGCLSANTKVVVDEDEENDFSEVINHWKTYAQDLSTPKDIARAFDMGREISNKS